MRVILHFIIVGIGALGFSSALSGCSNSDATPGAPPRAEYDAATGRLRRLAFDANLNGRHEAVSVMDGARLDHIELDSDENGKTDYWEYYDGPRLVKVGVSRHNDGILDAFQFYGPGGGENAENSPIRVEVSTRRDGRFDRVEFYANGILSRVEEDADRDGRIDKWELYRPVVSPAFGDPPSSVTSVAFDDAHRGTPTRRILFADDGTVHSVESDADGDGVFAAQPAQTRAR